MMLRTTALAGIAIAIIFAACGGGETQLTASEYFHDFQRIDAAATTRLDEEANPRYQELSALMQQLRPGTLGEANEQFEEIRIEAVDVLELTIAIGTEAVDALSGLEPPSDVRDAHLAYVIAGADVMAVMEDAVDRLRDADSNSEVITLSAPSADQELSRAAAACEDLRRIAIDLKLIDELAADQPPVRC